MVRTFRLFRGLNLLVKERMVGVQKTMVTQKVLKTESNLGHEAANETDSVYIYMLYNYNEQIANIYLLHIYSFIPA